MNRYLYPTFKREPFVPRQLKVGDRVSIKEEYFAVHDPEDDYGLRGVVGVVKDYWPKPNNICHIIFPNITYGLESQWVNYE